MKNGKGGKSWRERRTKIKEKGEIARFARRFFNMRRKPNLGIKEKEGDGLKGAPGEDVGRELWSMATHWV